MDTNDLEQPFKNKPVNGHFEVYGRSLVLLSESIPASPVEDTATAVITQSDAAEAAVKPPLHEPESSVEASAVPAGTASEETATKRAENQGESESVVD